MAFFFDYYFYYFIKFFCFVVDKKVNADELRNIENTLNNVTREQKEVLLTLVNLFVEMLNNKLKEYKEQGVQDPMSKLWFWWAYGFFKEIGRSVSYIPYIYSFNNKIYL